MQTFKIDKRIFLASDWARKSPSNWLASFRGAYRDLPEKQAIAFATRDFKVKQEIDPDAAHDFLAST